MTTRVAQLSHRLLRGVLLAAGGASLLLGVVFLGLYRQQLENERAEASLQLNRMLQVVSTRPRSTRRGTSSAPPETSSSVAR